MMFLYKIDWRIFMEIVNELENELEFPILKRSNGQGFFVVVADNKKLNFLVSEVIKNDSRYKSVDEFWELFNEVDASRIFSEIVACGIEYRKTGWQQL